MSLPNDVLAPGNRAFGMGLFFTVFYGAIFVAPAAAGWLAQATGSAAATFSFGGIMLLACLVLFAFFKLAGRRRRGERASTDR